jgi:hypothetical protein
MISVLYFSELAPHVDGFIAAVAHTIVVGASKVRGELFVR